MKDKLNGKFPSLRIFSSFSFNNKHFISNDVTVKLSIVSSAAHSTMLRDFYTCGKTVLYNIVATYNPFITYDLPPYFFCGSLFKMMLKEMCLWKSLAFARIALTVIVANDVRIGMTTGVLTSESICKI